MGCYSVQNDELASSSISLTVNKLEYYGVWGNNDQSIGQGQLQDQEK